MTRDKLYKTLQDGKIINWRNENFQIVTDKHDVLYIKRLADNATVWLSDNAIAIDEDFIIQEDK